MKPKASIQAKMNALHDLTLDAANPGGLTKEKLKQAVELLKEAGNFPLTAEDPFVEGPPAPPSLEELKAALKLAETQWVVQEQKFEVQVSGSVLLDQGEVNPVLIGATKDELPEGLTLLKTPSGAGILKYHGIHIKTFPVMPTTWTATKTSIQFHSKSHVLDLPWALIRETEFWGRIKEDMPWHG
jgi:hypothetical protein